MKPLIICLAALLPGMANLIAQSADKTLAQDFPKQTMAVTVVDEFGQPMEGVKIHRSVWTKEHFPANTDLVTNHEGQVDIVTPVATSILRLWATKKSYVPLFVNFEKRQMSGKPLPADFTFQLARGTTIGGFIEDELGRPIAHANVEVRVDEADMHVNAGSGMITTNEWLAEGKEACRTDERGFWSLDNAPPGGDLGFSLWLSHPDFVSDLNWRGPGGKPGFTTEELRTQNARVSMVKGVKISGAVKDPDGKPVAQAMVIWGHDPYQNPRGQETFTDQSGVYHLPPLAAEPTPITLVAEGYAPQLQVVTPDINANTNVDFDLERGNPTHFHFVDDAGEPIPKVSVNVAGWRGELTLFNWRHSNVPYSHIPDRADDKGEWKWDWAPGDAVNYYFRKEGYESEPRPSYGPGEHEVVLLKKK